MRLGADVLLAAVLVCAVHAWSLFPRKRFKEEGFLRAGSLGLEDVRGQVAAWGYFRDDRFLDAWIVDASRQSVTVHEWNHAISRSIQLPPLIFPCPVTCALPMRSSLILRTMDAQTSWSWLRPRAERARPSPCSCGRCSLTVNLANPYHCLPRWMHSP